MPDKPELNVSQLPPELCEVETLLKQFSPTASSVDRDALMYQAGYAAATNASRRLQWLWPATTAALAASLFFLLTFPAVSTSPRVEGQPENLPAPIAEQEAAIVEPNFVHAVSMPLMWYSHSAPMLVMRERALRGDFGKPRVEAELVPWASPSSYTNRQLLREFLPVLPESRSGGNS